MPNDALSRESGTLQVVSDELQLTGEGCPMKVYKFEMKSRNCAIEVTGLRRVLTVQRQRESICVWCEVDEDDHRLSTIPLMAVGTGHPLPDDAEYTGHTVQVDELVWHIYTAKQTAHLFRNQQ